MSGNSLSWAVPLPQPVRTNIDLSLKMPRREGVEPATWTQAFGKDFQCLWPCNLPRPKLVQSSREEDPLCAIIVVSCSMAQRRQQSLHATCECMNLAHAASPVSSSRRMVGT